MFQCATFLPQLGQATFGIRYSGIPAGWAKSSVAEYHEQKQALSQFFVGSSILSATSQSYSPASARKREHSCKLDEVYPLIESCSRGPYLELFARERRKNWTIWGNEAPEDENRFNGKTNRKAYSLPLHPEKHDTRALNF